MKSLKNIALSLAAPALALSLLACGGPDVLDSEALAAPANGGSKDDSGWLGSDSYEVGALVTSSVTHEASGDWADLATSEELQAQLVDLQLKYAKVTAESHGWRLNQLADTVSVRNIETDGKLVTIEYEAVIDMLGRLNGQLPSLSDITPGLFSAKVPTAPVSFTTTEMNACAKSDGSHSIRDYNFHYYFAPEQEGCDIELSNLVIEITEVFERPITYPEYDQLLQQQGENQYGFMAALVPNRGDEDPLSRFKVHAQMLEQDLGLDGTDSLDGAYRRYEWSQGDVVMIIDLYDPTQVPWSTGFDGSFREKLGAYTLVHYNGHSSYGSKNLLDNPESFSDAYQILSIHSCQSYAYYTRQIFRAKATLEDPSGFALADVLATGKSSYPSGAPPTLETLLSSLMDGMVAIRDGRPESAPDWLTITKRISHSTWGDILYGIAGVRTNTWTPENTH